MNVKSKHEAPTKSASKTRTSLVLKLNFLMAGRLISGFLAINILIILMAFFVVMWKSEEGALDIIDTIKEMPGNIDTHIIGTRYKIFIDEKPGKGIELPNAIQKRLPVESSNAKRSIRLPEKQKGMKFLDKIYGISYIVELSIHDSYYRIIYPLGLDLKLFFPLFIVLIVFELFFILGNLREGYKKIRRTLKPISELAKTAQNINAAASAAAGGSQSQLKDLAGIISGIDANKLDSQISIDSSQVELKDLAYALNGMLNRINDSYQSQVRFVSDASHELRTPISVIQGYANLLDRWGKNDEKALQESIDAIKSEAGNMKDLVEQLLFLARGDNETIQLHKEVFDCCETADEIIKETQMIDNNHVFRIQLDRPAYINADKQLLKQAIRILIDNSIKFTPIDDKIYLRIIKKEGKIHIVIQDNGIGIEADDLSKIFERFYRSDESRARKTGGAGLGLSIAKWIIERHGAYFEILSRVNIGTRITIIFPEEKESEYAETTPDNIKS